MRKKNVTITLTKEQAYNLLNIVRDNINSYDAKYDRPFIQKDKRIERRITKAIDEAKEDPEA